MASIEEYIAAVRGDIEALKQAQTAMDSAKQQAEELSEVSQNMGAEQMATDCQALGQGTEQARNSITPIIVQLEDLITQAEAFKTGTATGGSATHTRPPPTPLDAAPADLKEPVAKVGDPVTAPEPGPGPYRQELAGPDDDDESSKFGRATQVMASGADDLGQFAKQATDNAIAAMRSRDPNPPAGTTYTGTEQPQPVISGPAAQHAPVGDWASTGVMLGAVTLTFLHNMRERRHERKRDDN